MTTQTLAPDGLRPARALGAEPARARSTRRLVQAGASFGILALMLGVVLPRVAGASWESAVRAVSSVSPWQLAALTALWLVGLWAYSFVLAASLPGLTRGQGFVLNLVGSGVSNLVPFGGAVGVGVTWAMARQYGFSHRAIGIFTAVTGVWNVLARLALPLAGLVPLLAVGATVSGSVLVAAAVGAVLCALVVAALVAGLVNDRFAAAVIALLVRCAASLARLLRRDVPVGLGASLAGQRVDAVDVLKRGRGGLVVGMLAYLVLQGVLMGACLAAVGSDLGWAEVTAGYALGRMLTTVVLTPGGTGFAETGTAAAFVALGGDPVASLAGVLLFSLFTYACEIPGGALAYGWHLRARHWRRPVADTVASR